MKQQMVLWGICSDYRYRKLDLDNFTVKLKKFKISDSEKCALFFFYLNLFECWPGGGGAQYRFVDFLLVLPFDGDGVTGESGAFGAWRFDCWGKESFQRLSPLEMVS